MSTQPTYLDFELRLDDLGSGHYRATVVDMPLGDDQAQVSHDFVLPFAADELDRLLAVVSGRLAVPPAEQMRQARAFGEALFRAVFGGDVYTVYFSSRDRARTRDGLRIKLALDNAGALVALPWEFLRDPALDYLALSRSTPLVRYPQRLVLRSRPVFEPPLRVLVMVSSPSDLPPVDAGIEWRILQTATARLHEQGKIEMELLVDASLRTLRHMLRARDYHVFHYIGHSAFDATTGQGMLALEDPTGENSSFPVRAEDLARELGEENTIRLVVLNACQTAIEQQGDPFAGIASSIVARGIPAVIAMQHKISDPAARAFSEELYRAVADGLPVDAALADARRAINDTVGGTEWATPVLHMRAANGRLFDFPQPAAETISDHLHRPTVLALLGALLVLVIALLVGSLNALTGDEKKTTPVPLTDLIIDQIEVFPARPTPGERVAIIVRVTNTGQTASGPFTYDFRQDVLADSPDYTAESDGLGPGDSATLFVPHAFTWWGAFIAEVRIDTHSKIAETDEINNIARYPVVTSNNSLVVNFNRLPDGQSIDQSMPITKATFAAWGLRVEAMPNGDAACDAAVPWIIVEEDDHYLGTGLPDTPDTCTSNGLAVVLERSAVSGVTLDLLVSASADVSLIALSPNGTEIGQTADSLAPGAHTLELKGGFPARLDIIRAELVADQPVRVTRLALSQPG